MLVAVQSQKRVLLLRKDALPAHRHTHTRRFCSARRFSYLGTLPFLPLLLLPALFLAARAREDRGSTEELVGDMSS